MECTVVAQQGRLSGAEKMSGTADFFYREAMRLGYVARSAFKLSQMQKQYNLIRPGDSVLDLGCAPGAWLQVACQSLGPLGKGGVVVGVDVKKVKVPSTHCDARVRTVCADVMSLCRDKARELSPEGGGFSVILSDMCPSISGITTKDAALSCELGIRALSLALGKVNSPDLESSNVISLEDEYSNSSDQDDSTNGILRLGGNLVIKFLESEDAQGFGKFCKSHFKKSSWLRPKATRPSSREIYLICQATPSKQPARPGTLEGRFQIETSQQKECFAEPTTFCESVINQMERS